MLFNVLLVAAGGAIGSALRFLLSGWTYRHLGTTFPWGTLLVNVVGCFAIGLLWGVAQRLSLRPSTSVFLFGGILGAFTTFATFGLETFTLLRSGEIARAVAYVGASNVIGLLVVFAGYALAQVASAEP